MSRDIIHVEPIEIITFNEVEDPELWVKPGLPRYDIEIVDHDERWSDVYETLAGAIRRALGDTLLHIQHIGSTSVPNLGAKPIIDIDIIVDDPADESRYRPQLGAIGYDLVIREPNWYRHRAFRHSDPVSNAPVLPLSNLHVFGPNCAEVARHLLFRDRLRSNPADRIRYQAVKRRAAVASNEGGETVMEYNARKQSVIREIYRNIFVAQGWM